MIKIFHFKGLQKFVDILLHVLFSVGNLEVVHDTARV